MRFPGFEGEWEDKELKEVTQIGRGKSKHRPRDADFLFGGRYPFVQTGDIKKADLYLTEYSQTYSDAGLQQSKLWDEETLCVTIAANIAETAILKIKACFPDSIIGLNAFDGKTTSLFLKHSFDKFKIKIQGLSQGAAQDNLNQEKLSNIKFAFPTIEEQKKITQFVSIIDERISTQSKIIENLKSQINNLGNKLFDQQMRLSNDNGESFEVWQNFKGCEIFENISDKRHNSDLPILAITQEHGAIPRNLIDYQISVTDKSIESYKVVERGDFIISLRSFQGGIEYSRYKGICSPAYVILRAKIEIDHGFYRHYLRTENYIKLLNSRLEGIRDGKMISYKYFSDISLPYPSISEQRKIASFLGSLEQKIDFEKQLLGQYQNQKTFFLRHLFI